MEKISAAATNAFCPQPLFLYGTYKDDGTPNYGLFCWATYCYVDKFRFVACIGEDKLTRDLIRRNGVFSANAVTEELLPAADYCGTHSGYREDKSFVIPSERGEVLAVPVPEKGMWTFELKVDHTLRPDGAYDSEIYVCSIENVRADKRLCDSALTFEQKLALACPVVTLDSKYVPIEKRNLGDWGSFMP